MNIERELSLANFSYHLKANPDQARYVAFKYYIKFLNQQEKISNLEQNCKKLEREQEELYADYEILRMALEKEQRRNIASDCDLHLRLPDFLAPNPHNYL